ncbi:MAG: 6-carboxytetrahydropterin synthase QueD [Sandaracinaceae bacterium]
MRVAKRFRWEAAHRLPWHDGLCKNNHGHSYILEAAVDGAVDDRGMVLDFAVIKRALKPLVEAWDHATLVYEEDERYLAFVRDMDFKHYVLPYDTTAENLARYAADRLLTEAADDLTACGATSVSVRVYETATAYAELVVPVAVPEAGDGAVAQAVFTPRPQPGPTEPPALHDL